MEAASVNFAAQEVYASYQDSPPQMFLLVALIVAHYEHQNDALLLTQLKAVSIPLTLSQVLVVMAEIHGLMAQGRKRFGEICHFQTISSDFEEVLGPPIKSPTLCETAAVVEKWDGS